MKKVFSLIGICILGMIISSCGNDASQDTGSIQADSLASSKKDTGNPARDFFYSLPSPIIMAKIFKKTGLKYVEGVANSPDNVSKYTSVQSKTLNLGIYSADLAFTVLNKQPQQASLYMEAVKRLSDELGMSSLFNTENYLKRFKNNLDNEDSLISVVCQLKSEMDAFMQDNEKEKETVLVFMGAWVENVYIATQLTKEANMEKVASRVADQKSILNNLMDISTGFQTDPEFKKIYQKLNELKGMFDNLTVQEENEKVTMDALQLKAITEKTRDIRKSIVG